MQTQEFRTTCQWALMTGALAIALYYGFYIGIDGAQYLVKFFIWLGFLSMMYCATHKEMIKRTAEQPPVPKWQRYINRCLWLAMTLVLVWNGAFFTAVAALLCMTTGIAFTEKVEALRDNAKQSAQGN